MEADTNSRTFERDIFFPFEGEQVTFSLDIDSRSGTYATELIRIIQRDNTGSAITSAVTNFSSTGRQSVTDTLESSVVSLTFEIELQASSGTVTEIISDPCLRIGTGTTYTKF